MNKSFELIAETAFSHEGRFDYLISQIDAAAAGKADFVKFQILMDKEAIYPETHPLSSKIEKWMFSANQWDEILSYTRSKKLKSIALPLEMKSLQYLFLNEDHINMIEIHSVCFNEYHMLNYLQAWKKQIILGIGGRLPTEISYAIRQLKKSTDDIILMFGFQSFPTDFAQINLSKLNTYSAVFNCNLGYADHTGFDDDFFYNLNDYAYLLGCQFFEKHIVVQKGERVTDYESAIDSADFCLMRDRLNQLNQVFGHSDIFTINRYEEQYRNRGKKIVASMNLDKNHVLNESDLAYKFTDEPLGFEQKNFVKLIGKQLSIAIQKDRVITCNHIGKITL